MEIIRNEQRSPRQKEPLSRSECPTPKGKLLAIGGKENKGQQPKEGSSQQDNRNFADMQILERFVSELRGENPLVAIVPTPSSEPEEMAKTYLEVFRKLGLTNLEVVDIRSRQDASSRDYLKILERAAGIMFTGGDQLKVTATLGGTPFLERLKERYTHEEIIIAGTSAGAAALSTPMIYSGQGDGGYRKGDVYVTTGLEFMRNVAIDTHFIARGRLYRMTQCILTNPQCMGIGLEEDTAVLVTEGNRIEVLGSGLVTLVDGSRMGQTNLYEAEAGTPLTVRDLKMHLLGRGDVYVLPVAEQQHK